MAGEISWEDARDLLKKYRDDNVRDSRMVVDLWQDVLYDYSYKLGDDVWQIYEQVCVAAIDTGEFSVSDFCLSALKNQFPNSIRVQKLTGFRLEAIERYEEASYVYETILDEDETNSTARKRLVAVLKAQNKIPEAIKELNKYLDKFMADHEGWMELCDLYLQEMDYGKAAFCMEELILSNAYNHLYYQKYADIKYSHGGHENMEMARSYYSQALKLNPKNMRAQFGLFMSAAYLSTSAKGTSKSKRDNVKIAAWASTQISKEYQKSAADHSQPSNCGDSNQQDTAGWSSMLYLDDMMKTLQISHTAT